MTLGIKSRYGNWGLIAGAAEGLGEAYASLLAEEGLNLILVDQQKDLQDKLASRLESSHGIHVKAFHLDLAEADSVQQIMEAVTETSCRLLIYNAAFSRVKKFMENDPNELDNYLQVNIRTPLQLVYAFCHLHHGQKDLRKGIILMSSMAGSWGIRLLGPYGGTKAFSHILAEALHFELKEEGFDVLASVAGPTATPGYLKSLPKGKEKGIPVMQPYKVVRAGLRSLGLRAFVIPGFRNKLNYFLMSRILPRSSSLKLMNLAVANLYREKF
jgi:short-subunit dehydrogenase